MNFGVSSLFYRGFLGSFSTGSGNDVEADLVLEFPLPGVGASHHEPALPWKCCVLELGKEVGCTHAVGSALQQSLLPLFTSIPIPLQIIEEEATLGNCCPAFKEEVAFHTFIFSNYTGKAASGADGETSHPLHSQYLSYKVTSHHFGTLKLLGILSLPRLPFLKPLLPSCRTVM